MIQLGIKRTTALLASLACMAGADSDQLMISLGGFLHCPLEKTPDAFNAGYAMYPTIWSLVETHPGKAYQSGLVGTWMRPQNDDNPAMTIGSEKDEGGIGYTTIEGGSGVWRHNHFPTKTPKFQMGGVALSFKGIANGPGFGKGTDWTTDRGRYGVAQLSPWIVFPPDGLNFKQGEFGKVYGYGYHPLPLTPKKSVTDGRDVPTGNHSWTLFVNTKTFKGPIAFFTPHFWSRHTLDYPNLHGKYFDSRPSKSNASVSIETQTIPAIQATDQKGDTYARVTTITFPLDSQGRSHLMTTRMNFSKSALWDSVEAWFAGGPVASGKFDPAGVNTSKVLEHNSCGWKFFVKTDGERTSYPIMWNDFAQRAVEDDYTLSFQWHKKLTQQDKRSGVVKLPEYYKLEMIGKDKGRWHPIEPGQVPYETGLRQLDTQDFYTGQNPDDPWTTPEEADSAWKKPGPAAGPFTAKLGDGSTLTYYWYKFRDQPAMHFADLSDQELDDLQARVELMHRYWKKDGEYLPAPKRGELVEFDPALIVSPPRGLEIGYVPIATDQRY
ncbi:hypothetical protein [Pontiella sp.]|uniref:hypothetical protein n=1 Tax=Pontiella sp. TaxID=2837462 RepID=UPI003568215E